ncbi:MAG TPA: ferredoxin [Solirubrobacteraceae bacterium]|nr:ferredoxin [Solirubrobacteraceae bacterium]
MRVIVDVDVCAAHGDCVVAAPEIFDLGDDDDVVTVINPEPDEALRASAEQAVSDCPVSAIRIEE